MAKKAANPRRQRKSKQGWIDGMEPPSIPELDDAADELADVRAQRMALTDAEAKSADRLMLLMKKHKLRVYEYGEGRRVEIVGTEKVKVRKAKGGDDGNGDGDE